MLATTTATAPRARETAAVDVRRRFLLRHGRERLLGGAGGGAGARSPRSRLAERDGCRLDRSGLRLKLQLAVLELDALHPAREQHRPRALGVGGAKPVAAPCA